MEGEGEKKGQIIGISLFCRLKKEYEEISDKALTTPSNTEQMMELKEYIENIQQKEIYGLDDRMVQARQRVLFLVRQPEYLLSVM